MTDVLNNDFTLITSIDDVVELYRGNQQPAHRQTIGMETEICLYREGKDGKPVAATPQECAALIEALKKRGQQPQLEMASAVEYASPPFRVGDIATLAKEVETALADYHDAIRAQGLTPHDGALLPFATLESAKENLVDRDRARGLVKGMDLFKEAEFLKVTLLCTSTQISLSYADADDLYDTLATGYALSPVIYGLFANYPAYIEGKDTPIDFNPRAKFYEAFGKDGGIPQSLLKAKNGDEFIRNHAQQVFNTEMLFYYDRENNIVWPDRPVRFRDLEAQGLNTRSNYDLAETFIYTDLKVCNIRDESGKPVGKRVEVRGLDAGAIGVSAGVPFVHAVLRDADTRAAVQGLLLTYGIAPGIEGWEDKLLAGRSNAANHGGKFLDVPFGNGNLKDFCRELGLILKLHTARHPELAKAFAPLIDICETGRPQAEFKAAITRDYAHANSMLLPARERTAATPSLRQNFGR